MSNTIVNHQPQKGSLTKITVGFGAIQPVPQTLTTGSAAAKAATSITVSTALSAPIDAGNWLMFTDSNGLEYMAQLTADAAAAATTLTVAALNEAIPAGATANFPSELLDRSAVNVARTYNNQDVFTLNTGGQRQVVPTTIAKNAVAPGFWYWYNPGYRICSDAAEAGLPFWVFIQYAPPSGDFASGILISGTAIVSSRPTDSPANNFVSGDLNLEFTGPVTETLPTAASS